MTTPNDIQALENSIKHATVMVEMGNALDRLRSNKDFRRVVLDGYFKDEAIRLVMLKADTKMQSIESQASIVKQMDAIGSFNQYLTTVMQLSAQAERSIESDSQTVEELLAEGA